MLDAVEILNEKVGETVPVVTGIIGPAGLASMLAGMRNYLMWFVTNPEVVEELMGVLTAACGDSVRVPLFFDVAGLIGVLRAPLIKMLVTLADSAGTRHHLAV